MRRWSLLSLAFAACTFDTSGVGEGDDDGKGSDTSSKDPTTSSTSTDATLTTSVGESTTPSTESSTTSSETTMSLESSSEDTGTGGMPGPVCGGKLWEAQMDVDPTMLDVNGDHVPDWEFSSGEFPERSLMGGAWIVPTETSIRTRPDEPFATRTIVAFRGRAIEQGGRALSTSIALTPSEGAVMQLLVTLSLENDGSQTATIEAAVSAMAGMQLAAVPGLLAEPVEITIDLDPAMAQAGITVAGTDIGNYFLPMYGGESPAAVVIGARMLAAEVDRVLVESCP
ncbi:MAG TPA: hypothetical protein VG755_07245 [Nannocystaceae bacterium]|nr:hypothetical protein [Nannocystaceae bacterium]